MTQLYKNNKKNGRSGRPAKLICLLLTGIFLLFAGTVSALTYNVTSTTDFAYTAINNSTGVITAGAGVGQISLRSAIQAADATGGGPHIINVPAGTYSIVRGAIVFGNGAQNISIIGAGAATTVINMTTTLQDRIFFINPPGTIANVSTTLQGLRFTGGKLTSDIYGGGAILAGGPTNALTITSCTFDNNTIATSAGTTGGAINMSGGGVLTIDQSTFNNNTNPVSDGGAVYYFLQNFANLTGSMTITNSTFTNNGTTAGSGGAIGFAAQGAVGGQTFSVSIQKNTFIGNSATSASGNGGAIIANNSFGPTGSININYNRIVGNTATNTTTSGVGMNSSAGSVNATNNWWGCNAGPSAAGCNRAAIVGTGGAGTLNVTTWLQLLHTASPVSICPVAFGPGNTSTLTASFLTNSGGAAVTTANLTALIGLPITFNTPVLGTLSAAQTTIQANGTATATFTSNGTPGAGSANAVFVPLQENAVVTTSPTITINSVPAITTPPANVTLCGTGTATFSVVATGTAPTYQWQFDDGSGFVNASGASTGTSYTVNPATTAMNGYQYRVVITGTCGIVTSTAATLTVTTPPVVTAPTVTQPTCTTPTATVVVNATGGGTLEYSINNGGSFQASSTFTGVAPSSSINIRVRLQASPTCFTNYASNPVTINAIPTAPTVNNPATTTGTISTAFSQTFTNTGGLAPIGFTTTSTLPTGLALSATGTLSGTPTQSGTFPIVVKATDANGCVGTGATYNLVISCQAITVTKPVITTGTAGTAFSQTFTQTGGNGTTTFSTTSTLPTGLTLSTAGVLSGTPTQTGSFPIVVKATDANGCIGTASTYTLVISCQTITVTNPAVTSGGLNAPFSQAFAQTGGIGGITFTINTGTLPTGLTLAANGTLSGTPTQTGTFPVTVKVTDGNGCTGIGGTYNLSIAVSPCVVNQVAVIGTSASVYGNNTISNFNIPGGTNRLLLVTASDAIATTITSVTFNGTPMTQQTFKTDGNAVDAIFTLPLGSSLTPSTGNIVVTSGSANQFISANVLESVDQTNPISASASVANNVFPSASTQTIVGAANDLGFDLFDYWAGSTAPNTATVGGGQTLIVSQGPLAITGAGGGFGFYSTSKKNSSTSLTMSRTTTNGQALIHIVVNVKSAPATVITVTNPAITSGTVNTAFSQSFTASGGATPYIYTTSSTLPTGLSLSTAGVLSGTPTQAGTFPITVTATDNNGCSGSGTTYSLVINACPAITVTNPATTTGTVGTAFSQTFANATGGITPYTYSTASTLPTGLTLSSAGVLSGTPTQSGTFPIIVTAKDANLCTGNTPTYTLVIGCPAVSVNAVSNQVVCNGGSTTAVSFTGSPAGTVFNWTNNTPSIGLAVSGSGNIASFTATNATGAPIVATITVTPVYGVNCSGTPTTFTITVNPTATVTTVANQAVCNGANTTAVTFSSPTTGGTIVYNWTNNTTSIGLGASGSGDIASFVGTNATAAAVTATITVTPSYTNGAVTCTGTPKTFTITVNPTPTVNAVGNQTVCNGSSTTAITFSGATAGTVYNWTNNSTSIGLAASGSGTIAAFTATNATGAPVTATITVTPSYTNGGTTCAGAPTTFTITVNPTATVNTVANQVVCNGANTTAVTFSSPTTGGTIVYNWTNNTPSIGLAASGSGNITAFAATNATGAPVTATITVTPAYTNGATTCNGTPTTFTITVNPTATVNTVANQTLCNTQSTTAVNFSSPTTGGTIVYNWTNNTASIGLAASGSGNIPSFAAINTGSTAVIATITVTPSYTNGAVTCTGTPITFTITVTPPPATTCPGNINVNATAGVCSALVTYTASGSGTITYTFTGATTASGSGTGSGSAFNVGVTTVTVISTSSCGNSTCSFTVTVHDIEPPVITCPAQIVVCGTQVVNYPLPTVTDNCTIANPLNLTQSASTSITASNSVSCNNGAGHTANGYWRVYDLAALGVTGPYTVKKVIFGVESANTASGSQPATIKVYTLSGAFTIANLTQVASEDITIANQAQTLITVNLTTPPTVAANAKLVLEVFTPDGRPTGSLFYMGSNTAAQTAPNYITAPDCGVTDPLDVSSVGYPNMHSVLNAEGTVGAAIVPVQTAGLPSGSTFPVGTTVNTYTATDAAGNTSSCSFNVIVNPISTVNAVSNQELCNGATTNAVTFTGAVAGTVFNWTNNTPSIGLAASGSGDIAAFIATNLTNAPVIATITVTPSNTSNGVTCTGTPITFTITVDPKAQVNPVSSQVVCNGASTTTVTFAGTTVNTVYNWVNNTPSIGLAASGSGNIASFVATNATNAPIVATITVTPSFTGGTGSCPGIPITFTITVNPTATVNTVANQVICNGANTAAVTFTGAVAGTVFNWTNNTTSIGLAASGSGNIASFVGTNATGVPVTATITVTPAYTNGAVTCTGTPITFTITVNPTPTVNTVANQVVCNGANTAAVTFSGTAPGTVYNWTNNTTSIGLAASGSGNIASFVATNATTAPIIATITVTPSYTNGGTTCTGTPKTFTITVNPTATVNTVANQVICNGANTTAVTFSSPTTGGTIVYNWTNNTPSIGLAASGAGNIASFVGTNATGVPVTATITVTPAYTNGAVTCTGTPITFTITVNPTPTVNTVANQVVCNGANTAAVTFSGTAPGTVYNWTNNTTSIGLAASGSGNIASFVATNATTAPVIATITVTPSYTNGGTTCTGTPKTFTITVNPTATVNTVANQVICNGANTTAVTFSSPTTGGTIVYNWTNNTPSIGLAASGAGNIASFVATNATTAPVTATITVTPAYTNGVVTCTGTPITFTITVNPTATVNTVANQVVCNGANTTAVTFSSPTTGGTIVYNWTNNAAIGLAASGSGDIASFVATNSSTAPVIATITVTPTYSNGGTSCVGTPKTFTITVNPTATINAVANQTVCNGANTTAIAFSSPTTGGTIVYNWTNNTTSIGLAASGAGNIASFVGTNTTTAPVTATITVTPAYTNGAVTCTGTPITFTITVNPTATVNTVANQVICNGANTTAIAFSSPTTGGTIVYNWTNNTTSIGLAASGAGNIASFVGTNTTTAPVTATITVTPSFTNNGVTCTGTPITFTITVNPTATINAVANQVICNAANTTAITFSSPTTGGTIVYNWTNNTTSIGLAASGSGNIASFVGVNATTAPVTATITVTPTYSNGGATCVGTPITFTITVNPVATVTPVASQTICNNANTTAINFSSPTTGGTIVYNWINSTPSIGLAAGGTGNIPSFVGTNALASPVIATIIVTPTYSNGGATCVGTPFTFTITVNPTATVNTVANQVVCNNANTTAIAFSSPTTGGTIVYNWANNTPSIGLAATGSGNIASFVGTNVTTAPVTATITVTPTYSNGGANCVGTPTTFTITVNPTATVTAVANQTVCNNANTAAVTFSSPTTGGTIVYNWTNSTPAIGLAAGGTGNIPSFVGTNTTAGLLTGTITVTPTYSNGGATCVGTALTFTITVNPVATVNTVANQVICNNGNTTAVNFSSPTTGGTITYNWTNNTTSIGLGASGTGNIPSFVGTNATTAPVTATITVTPTYSNGGANCVGTPTTFTITVNPVPIVNTVANQVLCNKSITAAVTFSSPNTGGTVTYNWTNNNATIGLGAAGTGNIPSFISNNTTAVPQVATITVTPTFFNGGATCTGPAKTFTITVNPTPAIVVLNAPSRICLTDTAVVLRATPAGGVWAGTALVPGALVNGVFDPAKSGPGAFTLTYTYVDPAFSCPGVAYANVFVVDCVERHNNFKEAMKIYPNPNNGKFSVKLLSDKYKSINLRLIDSRGREVGKFTFNNLFYGSILPFDVRSLASGVYMLEAYSDYDKATFQIVITH